MPCPRLATAVCGLAVSASAFTPATRQPVRLKPLGISNLLNRNKKDEAEKPQLDKRGFPVGDPRSKGGTEQDIGLQVGPLMWRWPTQWPYPPDFYDVECNATALEYFKTASPAPVFSASDLAALHAHFERNVPKGGVVVDLGAGEATALPADFDVQEIWGVSAAAEQMAGNERLTKKVVLDLNDPSVKLPFADASVDVVLCTNCMEFLVEPVAAFREVYRVLKPKGACQIAFVSKGAYDNGSGERMAKYWGDFTDAQKMYVAGSFYQFSGGGWSQLKGYDLTTDPASQKVAEEENPLQKLLNRGDDGKKEEATGLFVVSSVKAEAPPPDASPMRVMQYELWDEPALLPDERRLCTERLYALFQKFGAQKQYDMAEASVEAAKELGNLYTVLEPMRKVLPVPIRALLIANLAPYMAAPKADKDAIVSNLLEGLGLTTPQEAFWKPVGELTKDLAAEDKIWLLVDFVPCFGRLDLFGAKLEAFPKVRGPLAPHMHTPHHTSGLKLVPPPASCVFWEMLRLLCWTLHVARVSLC